MNDFPNINDGDELVFFQNNFTKNEIKHALSKHNPKVELACLFSIKESLIKANNKLLNVNFNRIPNRLMCEDYQRILNESSFYVWH